METTELPTTKLDTIKDKKTIGVFVLILLAIGSLIFLGMKIERWSNPAPLLPNKACVKALNDTSVAIETFDKQLSAALKGQDAPAPDVAVIKTMAQDCNTNVDNYEVKEK